ncbi:MAG: flagellar hook-length control protein FliK [Candidatus Aureabacteria bacterium]|nr:flagellar hook-length control protein FliK [Candidatus Auribacterota bacterium]
MQETQTKIQGFYYPFFSIPKSDNNPGEARGATASYSGFNELLKGLALHPQDTSHEDKASNKASPDYLHERPDISDRTEPVNMAGKNDPFRKEEDCRKTDHESPTDSARDRTTKEVQEPAEYVQKAAETSKKSKKNTPVKDRETDKNMEKTPDEPAVEKNSSPTHKEIKKAATETEKTVLEDEPLPSGEEKIDEMNLFDLIKNILLLMQQLSQQQADSQSDSNDRNMISDPAFMQLKDMLTAFKTMLSEKNQDGQDTSNLIKTFIEKNFTGTPNQANHLESLLTRLIRSQDLETELANLILPIMQKTAPSLPGQDGNDTNAMYSLFESTQKQANGIPETGSSAQKADMAGTSPASVLAPMEKDSDISNKGSLDLQNMVFSQQKAETIKELLKTEPSLNEAKPLFQNQEQQNNHLIQKLLIQETLPDQASQNQPPDSLFDQIKISLINPVQKTTTDAAAVSQSSTMPLEQTIQIKGDNPPLFQSGEFGKGFDQTLTQSSSVKGQDHFTSYLTRAFEAESQIVNRIISEATLRLGPLNKEIHFQLIPPELGRIKVTLTETNGIMNGKIIVENHVIKEIVETNLSQLKKAISENIQLDKLNVEVADNGNSKNPFLRDTPDADEEIRYREWLKSQSQYQPYSDDQPDYRQTASLVPNGIALLKNGLKSVDLIG